MRNPQRKGLGECCISSNFAKSEHEKKNNSGSLLTDETGQFHRGGRILYPSRWALEPMHLSMASLRFDPSWNLPLHTLVY